MIIDSEFDLNTSEEDFGLLESLEVDEDYFSRETTMAAAVGDITGVTARPIQGWKKCQNSDGLLGMLLAS